MLGVVGCFASLLITVATVCIFYTRIFCCVKQFINAFGKIRPLYWPSLFRNLHFLGPHMLEICEETSDGFELRHVDIFMENIDLISPHIGLLIENRKKLRPHLDIIIPHLPVLILHIESIQPCLSKFLEPKVMKTLAPHMSVITKYADDLDLLFEPLLNNFDHLESHMDKIIFYIDEFKPYFPTMTKSPEILVTLAQNSSLVMRHLDLMVSKGMLPHLVSRVMKLAPYFSLLDEYNHIFFDHWDALLPHLDLVLDLMPLLAPRMKSLSVYLPTIVNHMDTLAPHLHTILARFDDLDPFLPDLCAQLPQMAQTSSRMGRILDSLDILLPVMVDLRPYFAVLSPYLDDMLPHAPKFLPHSKILIRHMNCWIPHLPILMQKLPGISEHIDCLAPSLEFISPHIGCMIPHLDELLPYSEVLMENFSTFLPYIHHSLPLTVKFLPTIARTIGGKRKNTRSGDSGVNSSSRKIIQSNVDFSISNQCEMTIIKKTLEDAQRGIV